jgi:purine-nucleoside phosphorylase
MTQNGIDFGRKPTWTIDAPYRETKKEIEKYTKEGIATVDMEASALFALGKVRRVRVAAAFAVSDVLGKKWNPQFEHINLKRSLDSLFDAAFDCLRR